MENYNILFIFSDQHRACDLGCYGNKQVVSPNFDRLSERSLRFNNCISNTPVCVPIRGSLLTGLHPNNHKAVTNDLPIDIKTKSIANILGANNYITGYIGKWHLGSIPRNRFIDRHERLGFQEWKVCNCSHNYNESYFYDENNYYHYIEGYESFFQTELAIDFIKRNNSSPKPWALYLSWGPPHSPYFTAPNIYKDLYKDVDIELRPNVAAETVSNIQGNQYFTKDQITEMYKGYYSHISALDTCLGQLLKCINELQLDDKTIIVYTSDHGDMLGSHGFINKQQPWFESINVPLLISHLGRIHPRVTNEIISLTDLPSSLLGFVGLSFDDQRQGLDLHSTMLGSEKFVGCECAYISNSIPCHQAMDAGIKEWYGVKTVDWTYVETLERESILINDTADNYQMNNCIYNKLHNATADSLRCLLREKMREVNDELVPWKEVILRLGLVEEWNSSQRWFNRPLDEFC